MKIILYEVWEKILLHVIQRIKKWEINPLQYINYLYSDICLCCIFNSNFCYGESGVNMCNCHIIAFNMRWNMVEFLYQKSPK